MKYLSKLLSVLLMGVMLYSTGCADYDEDIKSINNRIDQLVSGEIQPLKADLAKVKSDLEAAIAAAQAELKNIHDVDIANLKAADEALDAKIGVANDKILDLEEALNEEVKALEADIAALNTAIEAAKQAAKDGDAALKSELEKQIAALNTELSSKLAALEAKLDGEIADLREDAEKAIADANAAIDAVEKRADALEAADAEFAEELKTIKGDIETLNKDLAAKYDELKAATTANADDIDALEQNLAKLSETVDGINTTLANHLVAYAAFEAATNGKIAAIEGQISEINGSIETINGTLEDLQKQIDDNDADIEDIYAQIELLVKADAAMNEAIGALETDLSTLKADLEEQLTAAFGDVYAAIDAVKGDLSTFKRDMKGQLQAAAVALNNLNDALEAEKMNRTAKDNQLSAQLENLQKELKSQVDALNLRADAIETAYKAADEQLQKNLDAAVETLNDAIAAAIDESKAYTDEEIAELKAQLTDQHKKDITALNDRIDEKVKALEESIQAAWEDLNGAINCLNKAVAGLQEQVKVNAEQIDAILNRVQSVVYIPTYSDGKATVKWGAIITGENEEDYSFEYDVIAGLSKIDFQIYPAECAVALAEAWNNTEEDLKSFISFDWTGVSVRSAEPEFVIEEVAGSEDGVLTIKYKALNLDKSFYTVALVPISQSGDWVNGVFGGDPNGMGVKIVQLPMTKGYSISLVIDNESANISSSYVNLMCSNSPDAYVPVLVDENDEVCAPAIEEITEETEATFTIPYTDRNLYRVVFTADEDGIADGTASTHKYTDYKVMLANPLTGESINWYEAADKGYEIERPDFKYYSVYADEADAQYFRRAMTLTNGMLNVNFEESAGGFQPNVWCWSSFTTTSKDPGYAFNFYPNVALTDAANAASVGKKMALNVVFDVMGVELTTGEVIAIGKAVGEAAGAAEAIKWDYTADAAQDAAGAQGVYAREAVAVTIDAENANLHDFAGKYSAFIDAEVEAAVVEVAEDGTETAVEGVVATLAADAEENVTLAISNYAWDKTYKLTFVYELESIDITVEVVVSTLDRNREKVTLKGEGSIKVAKGLKFAADKTSQLDPINVAAAYDDIVARLNGTYPEAAEFLADVFTNAEHAYKTQWATKFTTLDDEIGGWGPYPFAVNNTIMHFVPEAGEAPSYNAYVGYDWATFGDALKSIELTTILTLWYGQEIELVYNIDVTVPTKYDFVHSDAFVFEDNGNYYSNAKGRYGTYANGKNDVDSYTKAVLNFSVYEIDMDAAFRVVEKDEETGEIVKYLTAEDMTALGLTATFDFVEEPEDAANIKFNGNKLSYNGTDASVRVAGKLSLNTGNASYELPTSFNTAEEGKDVPKYGTYKVNQFNPLENLSVRPDNEISKYVEVTESKAYKIDAIDYFDLYESREGTGVRTKWADGSMVNLIDHATGTWMVGNGTNGWYKNMTRTDIYGLTSEFKLVSEIPAEYAQYFDWNETTGELTFNADNQMQMANPIEVKIQMSVELPWAKNTPAEVTITFGPKK